MLTVAMAILSFPADQEGCVVEAGCYKGGSTAKLSLIASLCGRQIVVFDSFEGLPENVEDHVTMDGYKADFSRGNYRGTLVEVERNISKYGVLECCRFEKGWFSETMPKFGETISVAYIDVDLVDSTRDCLKYLYPRLARGGVIFSQDGHLLKIQELLADYGTWQQDIGFPRPAIAGLGRKKLVCIPAGH